MHAPAHTGPPSFDFFAGGDDCISKNEWDAGTAGNDGAPDWDDIPEEMTTDDCLDANEFQDFIGGIGTRSVQREVLGNQSSAGSMALKQAESDMRQETPVAMREMSAISLHHAATRRQWSPDRLRELWEKSIVLTRQSSMEDSLDMLPWSFADNRRSSPDLLALASPSTTVTALAASISLADQTHWLCCRERAVSNGSKTDGLCHSNRAGYGGCIASTYTGPLELVGLPTDTEPGFAGVPMHVEVIKRDFYHQVIMSDSSSLIILKSALAGSETTTDDSISIEGRSFNLLTKGRATFMVAIRPTFTSVSASERTASLLRQPLLYASGVDSDAPVRIMSSFIMPIYFSTTHICPQGYVLSFDAALEAAAGSAGACRQCPDKTYSLNPLSPAGCIKCPAVATCVNGKAIFGAVRIKAEIQLELPADSSSDFIKNALAERLQIDRTMIVLTASNRRRKAAHKVGFEIVGEPSQIEATKQDLSSVPGMTVGNVEAASEVSRPGEVWEEEDAVYRLKRCAPGYLLRNATIDSQGCTACGVSKYIIEGSTACVDCPVGAACPDGLFQPARQSKWQVEHDAQGVLKYRIVSCPTGHALIRVQKNPLSDNCESCKRGEYRLEPSYVNSSYPQCQPCDPKAVCAGGDVAEAVEGYWRFQPLVWDETYEYLPDSRCAGKEGKPCLFPSPSRGFVPMRGWEQVEMVCMPLPGGGDKLYCARPIPQKLIRSRRQGNVTKGRCVLNTCIWHVRRGLT